MINFVFIVVVDIVFSFIVPSAALVQSIKSTVSIVFINQQ